MFPSYVLDSTGSVRFLIVVILPPGVKTQQAATRQAELTKQKDAFLAQLAAADAKLQQNAHAIAAKTNQIHALDAQLKKAEADALAEVYPVIDVIPHRLGVTA